MSAILRGGPGVVPSMRSVTHRRGLLRAALIGLVAAGVASAGVVTALPAGAADASPPPRVPAPSCLHGVATDPGSATSPGPSPLPSPEATTVRVRDAGPRSRPADPLPLWRGTWGTDGMTTLAPRTGAIVVQHPYAPLGTVVWGGVGMDGTLLADGAAFDAAGWSRLLPPAPICPRRDFGWTFDGDSLVIWGGVDATGAPLADGAAWSFVDGTWTLLPEGPLPGGPAAIAADLADLWVVVTDAAGRPVAAHLHRPDGDHPGRWDPPVDAPLPAGRRYDLTACCTSGIEELLITATSDDAAGAEAVYSRFTDRPWTTVASVPLTAAGAMNPAQGWAAETSVAAWSTDLPAPVPGSTLTGPAIALRTGDHPTDRWTLIPAPAGVVGDTSLVLSPSRLVSVQGWADLDLVGRTWSRLPPIPSDVPGPLTGATAWWAGGRLWVLGGRFADGTANASVLTFSPRLPRGTIDLPGGEGRIGEACGSGESGRWVLRGDPLSDPPVWAERDGHRAALGWPDGWTARFRPDLEIVRSDGTVAARGGDRCSATIGSGG